MKKSQVNAILVDQTKRRNTIISFICIISLLSLLSIVSLIIYVNKSKNYSVSYKEASNIDYKVYLKDNKFFDEEFLGLDSKYIASLIKNIEANFKYEISMSEKNVDYKYSYRIDANVEVSESKSSKPLYSKNTNLMKSDEKLASSRNNVKINEKLDINYNNYNDLIKQFVSIYGLDDITSTLTVSMYIDVVGSCESFENDSNNESVISLVIPLTTKTVGIDIKNNLIEASDNVIICNDSSPLTVIYILVSIIFLAINVFFIYKLVCYIIKTRTAETIYDIELKKILNNYHSYIQRIKNNIDLKNGSVLKIDDHLIYKGCQFFKLESFTDMLEIRDSLNAPILMSTNDTNTATYFIILDVNNKAVYTYGLRVTDIKKQMKKEAIRDVYIEDLDRDYSK